LYSDPISPDWHASMLNITLSGICENWQQSSIHIKYIDNIFSPLPIFIAEIIHVPSDVKTLRGHIYGLSLFTSIQACYCYWLLVRISRRGYISVNTIQ